jgi:hypothetical protein
LTNLNPLVASVFKNVALTNKAQVARVYGALLHDVYEESKKPAAGSPNGGLTSDQRELVELVNGRESPIWFPRRDTPDHMSRAEKDKYGSLVANLDKLAAHATNAPPARAMVLADLPEPYQPHIFRRGNPSRLGEAVPRAYLQVLSGGEPQAFSRGSGRLDLANAIASSANPLTARVFVNRVWMYHFGEPLAASTTDFGTRNERPLQHELLDWLASDFIQSGWSVKHLHRTILLSAAYQQGSVGDGVRRLKPRGRKSEIRDQKSKGKQSLLTSSPTDPDPDNKLLSHFSRRRLDFEEMRDSLLLISGQLDLKMGGRSADLESEPLNRRRAVYGLVNRQDLPAMYRAFDFPVPDQCVERRPRTTVPQQALFALNSPFVMEQARALVALPLMTQARNDSERIEALFRRVLCRHATKSEIASALRFLQDAKADAQPKGLNEWEQLAQVLLISNEAIFLD